MTRRRSWRRTCCASRRRRPPTSLSPWSTSTKHKPKKPRLRQLSPLHVRHLRPILCPGLCGTVRRQNTCSAEEAAMVTARRYRQDIGLRYLGASPQAAAALHSKDLRLRTLSVSRAAASSSPPLSFTFCRSRYRSPSVPLLDPPLSLLCSLTLFDLARGDGT
eukprot:1926186-Rhodomonas_salina.1